MPAEGGGARILVADDEAGMRFLMRCVLEEGGYEVVEARNGLEAAEYFLQAGPRVDLVICDIQMPLLDGTELVAWLAEQDARVKILCVSGCAPERFPPPSRNVDRLQKPFPRKALQEKVRQILEEGEAPWNWK